MRYYKKVFLVLICSVFISGLYHLDTFAGFFLEGEYHNEPVPMSSLINETSWDAMSNYANDVLGVSFPTWSQASAVDDMLEDICMFFVGQTYTVSETVAGNIANAVLDSTSTLYDIWDFISFDGDTGEFVVNPHYSDEDLTNVIHGYVDPLIYDTGDPVLIGNWLPANQNSHYDNFIYSLSNNASMCLTVANPADCYFTVVHTQNSDTFLVSCTSDSAWKWANVYYGNRSGQNMSYFDGNTFSNGSTYTVNGNSYKYLSFAWRYGAVGGSSRGSIIPYVSINDALVDLWGTEHPTEPTLNGQGIVINDNPNYNPVTSYSVLNYDYSTHIVNNYNTGEPISWPVGINKVLPYSYEYKGIYWDSPLLETLEYPEEIEFPSVEFETISIDDNVDSAIESLDGGWIVRFFLVAILLLILGLIL